MSASRWTLSLVTALILGLIAFASASPNAQGYELHRMFGRGIIYNSQVIEARQVNESQIPPVCRDDCEYVTEVGTCTPATCCTNEFTRPFVACFVCVAREEGLETDFAEQQVALSRLTAECRNAGFDVDDEFFPGYSEGNIPTLSSTLSSPTASVNRPPVTSGSPGSTRSNLPTQTPVPPGGTVAQVAPEELAPTASRTAPQSTIRPSNSSPAMLSPLGSTVLAAAVFSASLLATFL